MPRLEGFPHREKSGWSIQKNTMHIAIPTLELSIEGDVRKMGKDANLALHWIELNLDQSGKEELWMIDTCSDMDRLDRVRWTILVWLWKKHCQILSKSPTWARTQSSKRTKASISSAWFSWFPPTRQNQKSALSGSTMKNTLVILDNGAGSIKAGSVTGKSVRWASLTFSRISNKLILFHHRLVPNAIVRSKGDKTTYFGHEIAKCKDYSSLHYRLPFEKASWAGACSKAALNLLQWRLIFIS